MAPDLNLLEHLDGLRRVNYPINEESAVRVVVRFLYRPRCHQYRQRGSPDRADEDND